MNKILKIVVAFLAITLTACKDEVMIIEPTVYNTYEVKNNLNEDVLITGVERINEKRAFEITLSSRESYTFFQVWALCSIIVEKDKFSVHDVSTIKFDSKTYGIREYNTVEETVTFMKKWEGKSDYSLLVIDESFFQ